MSKICPSIHSLRLLAGEGNYYCYKALSSGKRIFLFAKYLITTINYTKGKGQIADCRSVAYIKGSNQLRYYKHTKTQLTEELGEVQVFSYNTNVSSTTKGKINILPSFSIRSAALQLFYLTLMLLTGNKRYLNLYFLSFLSEMDKVVNISFSNIKYFICYNDQPYDIAAITDTLNRKKNGCSTIVIQHGLIISEQFYFPSNSRVFWAWGDLSKQHFYARRNASKIIIKGRYKEDSTIKKNVFLTIRKKQTIKILIAPSFHHDEVKQLCSSLREQADMIGNSRKLIFSIKYHPSTKFISFLKRYNSKNSPWLLEETEPMEILSDKYDLLITKNSTSSVDFLLRGKPVFFLSPHKHNLFPSTWYGFRISELNTYLREHNGTYHSKNKSRLVFIKESLNV